MSWSTSELRVRLASWNRFKPSSKIFYWPFTGGTSFMDLLCVFFCLVFAMPLCASVYMCFVVSCWERADLLALVCGVLLWVRHFPIGILGQAWYLIVSIPDLCTLTYFDCYSCYGVYWRDFDCLLDFCPCIVMRLFFGYLAPGPRWQDHTLILYTNVYIFKVIFNQESWQYAS